MQHEDAMPWHMLVLSIPHQNKIFCHTYRRRVYSRWQIALNLVASSSDMTYKTWLVYLQKSTIIYPPVASVRLTFHGQHCIHYENVFTSWGSDYNISLGSHALGARSWSVTRQTRNPYRTIETVLKQVSSWRDRSEIHITRREELTSLPFRRCVVTKK
jgi:hypothetical protein